jgi:putative spermidine/putrescine transport system ATP-binding protein
MQPFVRFDRVRRSFDGATNAVRDLTLDVARGEFLTLLGPSGSGKTTTLMMLAGFEQPDGGEILLDGQPITRLPAHRRNIGVVFQSYALFPHMTVAQNVAFPLEVRGQSKASQRDRVARALDMVRLAGFGDRLPAQLSGGQQQRVALARALVFEPRLVLMDEPLGALDRALREEMQAEIRHLHAALGVTMLYVTHDQAEALRLSDRIAVMAGGTLRQVGTPEELYETPQDAFVAGFLGESNFLPGLVAEIEDDIALVRLECGVVVEALAGVVRPGERCVVAVRPERIAVAAVAAEDMGDGALPATLLESAYLGDHVRLLLRVGVAGFPTAEVAVKRPAGVPMSGLEPGLPAALAWQAHHARAFPPGEAPPRRGLA